MDRHRYIERGKYRNKRERDDRDRQRQGHRQRENKVHIWGCECVSVFSCVPVNTEH